MSRSEESEREDIHRSVAGLSLRVREEQRDGLPPLLMTGAWPQSIRCWDESWEALAEHFSLTAVDLPGFGLSEGHRETMRPSALAAVLAELIEQDGRGPVTLVAPDVGVPVGLSLAVSRPDLLSGLVLFNGPAHHPPGMSFSLALLGRSRALRAVLAYGGVPFTAVALARGYRRRRPSRAATREYLRTAALPSRFRLSLDYQASYAQELPQLQASLPAVEVPTLLPWGMSDPFIKRVEGERLAAELPSATWLPLPGVGHFAHEDAGPRFVEALVEWHSEEATISAEGT